MPLRRPKPDKHKVEAIRSVYGSTLEELGRLRALLREGTPRLGLFALSLALFPIIDHLPLEREPVPFTRADILPENPYAGPDGSFRVIRIFLASEYIIPTDPPAQQKRGRGATWPYYLCQPSTIALARGYNAVEAYALRLQGISLEDATAQKIREATETLNNGRALPHRPETLVHKGLGALAGMHAADSAHFISMHLLPPAPDSA